MASKIVDVNVLAPLLTERYEYITCLECCSNYDAPATAECGGHTLCRKCWVGRQYCPTCASPVEKKALKLNVPLQKFTKDVHSLIKDFEKLFKINLDEFALEDIHAAIQQDPYRVYNQYVIDWLTNPQNQFPARICPQSFQDLNPQICSTNVKTKSPMKVLNIPLPQDDGDKIEAMTVVSEPMLQALDSDDDEF